MNNRSNDGVFGKFKKESRADASDPAYLRGETRQERRHKFEYKDKSMSDEKIGGSILPGEENKLPSPEPPKAPTFRSTMKQEMSSYRKANPDAAKGSLGFQQARSSAFDKAKGLLSGKVPSRFQMKMDRNKKRMGKMQPKPSPMPAPNI